MGEFVTILAKCDEVLLGVVAGVTAELLVAPAANILCELPSGVTAYAISVHLTAARPEEFRHLSAEAAGAV
jgi:hypothetical protein